MPSLVAKTVVFPEYALIARCTSRIVLATLVAYVMVLPRTSMPLTRILETVSAAPMPARSIEPPEHWVRINPPGTSRREGRCCRCVRNRGLTIRWHSVTSG